MGLTDSHKRILNNMCPGAGTKDASGQKLGDLLSDMVDDISTGAGKTQIFTLPLIGNLILSKYVYGSAAIGLQPWGANAVTISSVEYTVQGTAPTGTDAIITFHNITQATSDTATISFSTTYGEDLSINLAFAATDTLSVQITQIGSGAAGADIVLCAKYTYV